MDDPLIVGLRFALYATLLPLFGIPLFALTTPGAHLPRRVLGVFALVAIAISALSLAATTAAMAGTSIVGIDPVLIGTLITETPMGWAWDVRLAALMLFMVVVARASAGMAAALATVALGSLAWSGHGAAHEGSVGWLQLVADIAHLLAAGAWIGALAMLAAMLWGRSSNTTAQAALDGFARTGTIIVATIVVTGLINSAVLIGWDNAATMLSTPYGQLLALKIALFAAMLGLAALNLFRLTPALGPDASRGALRCSLALETGAALAILALVAWLGTLQPPGLE